MKIYTKKGDEGLTSLIGTERVLKNDPRVEAYGTIDELSAYLGLIKTLDIRSEDKVVINKIQEALFSASAFIASSNVEVANKMKSPNFDLINTMESEIDKINEKMPKMFEFSIPANNSISAYFNIARTICRRAERRVISIKEDFLERSFVFQLLNRLSDYLYMMYRYYDTEE
ncbi:MAG: cob(I)yrinic acid a,c-diamide adenosyltransferase [Bacteroidales bacterium]|jgi:cob(I)alamin adenosyltransferase